MKKLRIKDADGEVYEVEEVEETPVTEEEPVTDEDVEALTADEIAELKALLPQLKELVKSATPAEETPVEDEDIDETIEEDKEEVIDSCKDEDEDVDKITDSAASKKKAVKADDSVSNEEEINAAWKARYDSQLRGGRK